MCDLNNAFVEQLKDSNRLIRIGEAEFEKLVRDCVSSADIETDIYGYVAATQRIAYSTCF